MPRMIEITESTTKDIVDTLLDARQCLLRESINDLADECSALAHVLSVLIGRSNDDT